MKNVLCLIDNGHGSNTAGKRSPDGRLHEWRWARQMAQMISRELSLRGHYARLIVTEEEDVSLRERCRRVNAWCAKRGAANVLLISVHCNASGSDGKWHDPNGWSCFVAPNASANSKRLAQCLCAEAERLKLFGNRSVPREHYWVQNLAMCRDTKCPAVLTENLFQDNRGDVDYLLSAEGMRTLCLLHVEGIIAYLKS